MTREPGFMIVPPIARLPHDLARFNRHRRPCRVPRGHGRGPSIRAGNVPAIPLTRYMRLCASLTGNRATLGEVPMNHFPGHDEHVKQVVLGSPVTTFTAAQVEAALCIWEWMQDRNGMVDSAFDMLELWGGVGTSQMRDLAARCSPAVEALYRELCTEIGEDELRDVYPAYDWDFLPTVCEKLDWSGDMTAACYRSGLIALPDTVKPALLAEYAELKAKQDAAKAEREKLQEYKRRCRLAAGRAWGYPGLVDDDPETIRQAFERGDDPAELIEVLGVELDLTRPDPMTAEQLAEEYPAS